MGRMVSSAQCMAAGRSVWLPYVAGGKASDIQRKKYIDTAA